jgi:hypothetical protein
MGGDTTFMLCNYGVKHVSTDVCQYSGYTSATTSLCREVYPTVDSDFDPFVHWYVSIKNYQAPNQQCWPLQFPNCDGSHVAHNKETGDNVGPLLVKNDKAA